MRITQSDRPRTHDELRSILNRMVALPTDQFGLVRAGIVGMPFQDEVKDGIMIEVSGYFISFDSSLDLTRIQGTFSSFAQEVLRCG